MEMLSTSAGQFTTSDTIRQSIDWTSAKTKNLEAWNWLEDNQEVIIGLYFSKQLLITAFIMIINFDYLKYKKLQNFSTCSFLFE